jgi:hypothetical protein
MVWIRPLNSYLTSIALYAIDSFNIFYNASGNLLAGWLIDLVFRRRLAITKNLVGRGLGTISKV